MTSREHARTVCRLLDGLDGAGLLSEDGRKVRGYIATGQFGLAVEHSTGLSTMVRSVLTKIVNRTTELKLDDVDFGPKFRCETDGCVGIARTTADGRRLCTDCGLYASDVDDTNVITIEQVGGAKS